MQKFNSIVYILHYHVDYMANQVIICHIHRQKFIVEK